MLGGKDVLDQEYVTGEWDCLFSIDEVPRFSIISGYCRCFKFGGTLLEVGCGAGILQTRLDERQYSRFDGIDISSEAINRAQQKNCSNVMYICQDASSYITSKLFDVIIFNECLEYFDDPAALVKRYEAFTNEGALFIVSMFKGITTARTQHIWRELDARYTTLAHTTVSTKPDYTWKIKVYELKGQNTAKI